MNTSDSDIQSAIRAFNDGTFTIQKAAAKAYNVPRSTFRSRLNGSRGQAIAQQHRRRLSFDQEEFLTIKGYEVAVMEGLHSIIEFMDENRYDDR
ncbi:hypothetical protein K3495_g12093 [Podosphaera aphanis]|nr:hypothetical protein K3495_g12093 [Podosphaera aphanis]